MPYERSYLSPESVLATASESGGTIVDVVLNCYWSVNASAYAVWELAAEGRRIREIVAELERRWHVPDSRALLDDVAAFLDGAVDQGFLVVASPSLETVHEQAQHGS